MTKVNLFASIKGGVAIGTKRGHVVTKVSIITCRRVKKKKKKKNSPFFFRVRAL
jgi:hypothetical protein